MKRRREEKDKFHNSREASGSFRKRTEYEEKDTTPSKLDSVHDDLKMAIMSRLPAKSLMKFRCVSKMWCSFIRRQELVDSFFAVSSAEPRFIVSFSNNAFGKPEEKLTFLLSYPEGSSSSSLVPRFEMALPVGLRASQEYCASLHGFLSVYTDHGLMVCNPSTEQVFNLTKNTQFVGYDPIGGQHKALSVHLRDPSSARPHLLHKVLTLGGGWRDIEGTPVPYIPVSVGVCINGVIYYGGYKYNSTTDFKNKNPVVMCFDVRSEKVSFIQAPSAVVLCGKNAIFIEYNGKLASILVHPPLARSIPFDLWILEDAQKHEWSKQTCVFPSSAWESVSCRRMSFQGTNKAGEIIIVPSVVNTIKVQPFYIFYYNVTTNNVRRVRLLGIGDNEEFQRSYGFVGGYECFVRVAPHHVDSIAFLNNHVL
ncbi:putative F-box protein At1g32660 [Brassica rapa]|uniref:F-box domain-containing protein n=1 Tax=Brassica campestris TaxID=3711 RepID=M4DEF7_BRACM|nr:putative F-box protein At1g32660 [Brassica rapa]